MLLFSFFLPATAQNAVGMLAILGIGILHGANDLKIIQHQRKSVSSKSVSYFILYLGTVLIGAILFYWLPQAALPMFILVSAFHFGEQHWEIRLQQLRLRYFFYLCYGGFVFSLLFYLQATPTSNIIEQIVGIPIAAQVWNWTSLILGLLLLIYFLLFRPIRLFLLGELFLFGLLALLFWKGTLVLAFATYFVFWHSLPSLQSQMQFLYGSHNAKAWWNYFKAGFLYWILALCFLGIAFAWIDFTAPYFLSLFFIFLAAITFPHALVMELMFRKSP